MRRRQAVRALILSETDQSVLLLRMQRPDRSGDFWLLPGGGIKPDEDHLSAFHQFAPSALPLLVEGLVADGPPAQSISLTE